MKTRDEMGCCGEWTGKNAYDCYANGARIKQGVCNCGCHTEVKEATDEELDAALKLIPQEKPKDACPNAEAVGHNTCSLCKRTSDVVDFSKGCPFCDNVHPERSMEDDVNPDTTSSCRSCRSCLACTCSCHKGRADEIKKRSLCIHNGKCRDASSGMYCREWEENNHTEIERAKSSIEGCKCDMCKVDDINPMERTMPRLETNVEWENKIEELVQWETPEHEKQVKSFITKVAASARKDERDRVLAVIKKEWELKFSYKLNQQIILLEKVALANSIALTRIVADMYSFWDDLAAKISLL